MRSSPGDHGPPPERAGGRIIDDQRGNKCGASKKGGRALCRGSRTRSVGPHHPGPLSRPPPPPAGRRGEKLVQKKQQLFKPLFPAGGGEAGREGLGSEGQPRRGDFNPIGEGLRSENRYRRRRRCGPGAAERPGQGFIVASPPRRRDSSVRGAARDGVPRGGRRSPAAWPNGPPAAAAACGRCGRSRWRSPAPAPPELAGAHRGDALGDGDLQLLRRLRLVVEAVERLARQPLGRPPARWPRSSLISSGETKVRASPVAPARAVRPTRWM